jgi:hypothetical protein
MVCNKMQKGNPDEGEDLFRISFLKTFVFPVVLGMDVKN